MVRDNFVIVLALATLIVGCGATTMNKKMSRLRFADDIVVAYPQKGFDALPTLVQQVVVEQDDNTYEFTAMVELTEKSLTIAGLSPLGDRQFLISLDGNTFHYESQMMFDLPFPPQYLARDFLLIYARAEALERQLSGLTIHDTVNGREILYRNERNIEIKRDRQGFAAGDIRFIHVISGYNIHISTVQVNFPNEVVTSDSATPQNTRTQ